MIDQASELRRLVAGTTRADLAAGDTAPRIVVLAGGSVGAGVTTLACSLAVELAADAQRVVLADCDLQNPTLASRCGVSPAITLADVLAQKRTIHEALERGPAGMHLLAGSSLAALPKPITDRDVRRFCEQLHSLGRHAEWLIVDGGNEVNELTSRIVALADPLWIVTTADAAAVMDTYVLIKTLCARQRLARPMDLIVTRTDERGAADVHRRIDRSCRRFLGLSIDFAGNVPSVPSWDAAAINEHSVLSAALGPLMQRLHDTNSSLVTQRAA